MDDAPNTRIILGPLRPTESRFGRHPQRLRIAQAKFSRGALSIDQRKHFRVVLEVLLCWHKIGEGVYRMTDSTDVAPPRRDAVNTAASGPFTVAGSRVMWREMSAVFEGRVVDPGADGDFQGAAVRHMVCLGGKEPDAQFLFQEIVDPVKRTPWNLAAHDEKFLIFGQDDKAFPRLGPQGRGHIDQRLAICFTKNDFELRNRSVVQQDDELGGGHLFEKKGQFLGGLHDRRSRVLANYDGIVRQAVFGEKKIRVPSNRLGESGRTGGKDRGRQPYVDRGNRFVHHCEVNPLPTPLEWRDRS